jgi:hypothetical protein
MLLLFISCFLLLLNLNQKWSLYSEGTVLMKEVQQDERVGQIVGYKKYRESWLGNILECGHYMQ